MTGPRLVVADDDDLARTALAALLGSEPGLGPVLECDGVEQLRDALRSAPDLVLLADSLDSAPDYPLTGDAARSAPVLVLAFDHAETVLLPVLEAGALGVVAGTETYAELVQTIKAALRGEPCVPRGMLGSLLHDLIERRRRDDEALIRYRRLTGRERDVLRMLARGADVTDIAQALVLSPQTVRSHLQHVLDKLELHSRAEAVAFVVDHGLLDQSPSEGQQ